MKLVTDRSKADVLMQNEKGRYGAEDLNRVESAVAELYRLAKALGVQDTPVVKTDWGEPGAFSADLWPTESQMRRYLCNVSRLCQKVAVAAALPATMEHLDWEGANRIEQALELAYTRIRSVLQAFQYSGEIFAGEEYGL